MDTSEAVTRQGVAGSPVVLRRGTVLTMDDTHTVLPRGDVLVVDSVIAAVGVDLDVPEGTLEIDAEGGIVMPGMIDTHRHLWQTAMRGYGADWTLTQYFVWYYLEHGKAFRPEDVYAGNLLGAWEALESGVTTTVDWSHGLQSVDHAEAAADALLSVPGRFVLAYGNIQAGPWEWATDASVQAFLDRRRDEGRLGLQLAFDVTGDPEFPERPAFEAARDLGLAVTTHAGVWGATNDAGIKLMHDHGFMTPETVYVHAASLSTDSYHRIAATGGSISVSTESEQSAGQGYPPTWQVRRHDIPVSLSMDTSVWWSGDLFSAMRSTLGADRSREHLEAHVEGETVTHVHLRAEQVVDWATRGGAHALGRDDLGSLEPGKRADVVLLKNDHSTVSFPMLNPYGHVAFQAQRADVHTVLVEGRIVKHEHRLVGADLGAVRRTVDATVEHLVAEMGADTWAAGMNPDLPSESDGPRQPVHLHRLQVECHPRRSGEDVRRHPALGSAPQLDPGGSHSTLTLLARSEALPDRPIAHPVRPPGRRGAGRLDRAGGPCRAARLRAVLGGRAPRRTRHRLGVTAGAARRDRRPHVDDPARLWRRDAAAPPAARGRRAVPDARRALPPSARPRDRPLARLHRARATRPAQRARRTGRARHLRGRPRRAARLPRGCRPGRPPVRRSNASYRCTCSPPVGASRSRPASACPSWSAGRSSTVPRSATDWPATGASSARTAAACPR